MSDALEDDRSKERKRLDAWSAANPRDEMALKLIAAWLGVTVENLPQATKAHTSAATMEAWGRVADAVLSDRRDYADGVRDAAAACIAIQGLPDMRAVGAHSCETAIMALIGGARMTRVDYATPAYATKMGCYGCDYTGVLGDGSPCSCPEARP